MPKYKARKRKQKAQQPRINNRPRETSVKTTTEQVSIESITSFQHQLCLIGLRIFLYSQSSLDDSLRFKLEVENKAYTHFQTAYTKLLTNCPELGNLLESKGHGKKLNHQVRDIIAQFRDISAAVRALSAMKELNADQTDRSRIYHALVELFFLEFETCRPNLTVKPKKMAETVSQLTPVIQAIDDADFYMDIPILYNKIEAFLHQAAQLGKVQNLTVDSLERLAKIQNKAQCASTEKVLIKQSEHEIAIPMEIESVETYIQGLNDKELFVDGQSIDILVKQFKPSFAKLQMIMLFIQKLNDLLSKKEWTDELTPVCLYELYQSFFEDCYKQIRYYHFARQLLHEMEQERYCTLIRHYFNVLAEAYKLLSKYEWCDPIFERNIAIFAFLMGKNKTKLTSLLKGKDQILAIDGFGNSDTFVEKERLRDLSAAEDLSEDLDYLQYGAALIEAEEAAKSKKKTPREGKSKQSGSSVNERPYNANPVITGPDYRPPSERGASASFSDAKADSTDKHLLVLIQNKQYAEALEASRCFYQTALENNDEPEMSHQLCWQVDCLHKLAEQTFHSAKEIANAAYLTEIYGKTFDYFQQAATKLTAAYELIVKQKQDCHFEKNLLTSREWLDLIEDSYATIRATVQQQMKQTEYAKKQVQYGLGLRLVKDPSLFEQFDFYAGKFNKKGPLTNSLYEYSQSHRLPPQNLFELCHFLKANLNSKDEQIKAELSQCLQALGVFLWKNNPKYEASEPEHSHETPLFSRQYSFFHKPHRTLIGEKIEALDRNLTDLKARINDTSDEAYHRARYIQT